MMGFSKQFRKIWQLIAVILLLGGTACQTASPQEAAAVPTLAARATIASEVVESASNGELDISGLPPTFTPLPPTLAATITNTPLPTTPTATATQGLLPSRTPRPPTLTPSVTPTEEAIVLLSATPTTGPIKPLDQYGTHEIIPLAAFPKPAGDNGWGMHWIPTTDQHPANVDRFVAEIVRMHIKWVVFLNDGTDVGKNDYLVDRLVANGIMPVMRLYRSGVLPYDGDIGRMVRHYRARGVYYYQLYNEPNVDDENHQFLSNPNQYAVAWSSAARDVINNGGLPGIGALSPGGSYSHYGFLDRTLQAIKSNGDVHLLNHAWLSVHNYHGLRAYDDPDGFFLFRNYNDIVEAQLGRQLPMIGTEAGSYSNDKQVEKEFISWQYLYMREAEPYFFAHSFWLLANLEGGGADPAWEWQSLFRSGFVHPVVPEFFYINSR